MALMGLLPESARVSGSIRLDGQELVGLAGARLLRAARQPRQHDLPGADDGAQPDAHRRPPGRRAAAPAQGAVGARRRARRRSRCSTASAFPMPAARSTPTRTSSPAASASAITIAMALACEPGSADRRRADHRARRHHPGPDPRPDRAIWWPSAACRMILISHDLGVIARKRAAHDGDVWRHAWWRTARAKRCSPALGHPYSQGLFARAAAARRARKGTRLANHRRHRAGTRRPARRLRASPTGCDIAEARCRAVFPAAGRGERRPHRALPADRRLDGAPGGSRDRMSTTANAARCAPPSRCCSRSTTSCSAPTPAAGEPVQAAPRRCWRSTA